MKKNDTYLEVIVSLPEDFQKKLDQTAEEEIEIASRKWGLSLNTEDRKLVLSHARKQLEGKASSLIGENWDSTKNVIKVRILTSHTGLPPLKAPSRESLATKAKVVRTTNEWQIEQDPVSNSVPLSEFHTHMEEQLLNWLRTAVFYGVGSFTQN